VRWIGLLLASILVVGPCSHAADETSKDLRPLRCGWFHWDPYQYEEQAGDISILTGLDIRMLRTIVRQAGYRIAFTEQMKWQDQLHGVELGTLDIASGAFRTADRERYAWFSDPYRTETDMLFVRRGTAGTFRAATAPQLLKEISARSFRLGVVRGYDCGPEVDAFLQDPAHAGQIVYADTDRENLDRLLDGTIDGFIGDRLVAATMAWREGTLDKIDSYRVPVFSAPIHVIFSKATCTPEMVERFNHSLAELRASGEHARITRSFVFPVLLSIITQQTWFIVPGLIGTLAFAISGVLLARKENYDIFGAFVLASLPAVGGGVLRDVLTDRYPLSIMRPPPVYMTIVIATVIGGTLLYRLSDWWRRHEAPSTQPSRLEKWSRPLVGFFDAVGLAAFTVTGVVVAVEQQCEPLWFWGPLLAAITGAGGSIMRDAVRASSHNETLKGEFYPEIAVIWGFLFAMFLQWQTTRLDLREIGLAVMVTAAGALATRLIAERFGLRSIMLRR